MPSAGKFYPIYSENVSGKHYVVYGIVFVLFSRGLGTAYYPTPPLRDHLDRKIMTPSSQRGNFLVLFAVLDPPKHQFSLGISSFSASRDSPPGNA